MSTLRIAGSALRLSLREPFTIARGTRTHASTAIVRISASGVDGLGESAPSERYGESVASVLSALAEHAAHVARSHPNVLDPLLAPLPPAARCGLDLALHDRLGRMLGVPLHVLLGLDPASAPPTSLTIGIDTPERMLAKVDRAADRPILKIKLGTPQDREIVAAIRARYVGTIRLDANEAWTPEEAVRNLRAFARLDIEFCEQPIPAGTPERLRWIRERVAIPLYADEDAKDARDLPGLAGAVDGVCIKLVKTGGIRGALAAIATARALGLRVLLGSMLESTVLASAAAHLAPLADAVDLDGPLLTTDDPFIGVRYDGSRLVLPTAPGLGVRTRDSASAWPHPTSPLYVGA